MEVTPALRSRGFALLFGAPRNTGPSYPQENGSGSGEHLKLLDLDPFLRCQAH